MDRKLLILDLDETLIYATEGVIGEAPDFTAGRYLIHKRPHLDQFLTLCFNLFDVAIWSASNQRYLNAVIPELASIERFQFIWGGERCTPKFDPITGLYLSLKNLKKVKRQGYDLSDVIVVDDIADNHIHNYGNLVQIKPYYGERSDRELLILQQYLIELNKHSDIRRVEKRGWRARYN